MTQLKNSLHGLNAIAGEARGWTAIRLVAAICSRDKNKLSGLSESITAYFDEKDIREIWRRCKLVLSPEDTDWLKGTLRQLSEEQ